MTVHHGQMVAKNVLHCFECGFAHLYPYPTEDTVKAYYADDQFYQQHSPLDWFIKEQQEQMRGDWIPYYDHIAGLLNQDKPVIDIGCGAGWLISYLRLIYGLDVYGVEPSAMARQFSPVRDCILPDVSRLGRRKGNVILALTLEHIVNPLKFLQTEVIPHLDGRLIVVVPNEFNLLQRQVNQPPHKDWFVAPVHVNYFNPASLRELIEAAGLTVVSEGSTFPMEAFIRLGLDYRGNDQMGRKCHRGRLFFESLLGKRAYWIYQRLYQRWHIGRELIMVGDINENS